MAGSAQERLLDFGQVHSKRGKKLGYHPFALSELPIGVERRIDIENPMIAIHFQKASLSSSLILPQSAPSKFLKLFKANFVDSNS